MVVNILHLLHTELLANARKAAVWGVNMLEIKITAGKLSAVIPSWAGLLQVKAALQSVMPLSLWQVQGPQADCYPSLPRNFRR